MSRNIDIHIVCPFYQEPPGSARGRITENKRIRCEGVTVGGRIMLEFRSRAEREAWCDDFCRSQCYRGCPIAQLVEDVKYSRENKKTPHELGGKV